MTQQRRTDPLTRQDGQEPGPTERFREARDFLLVNAEDYQVAHEGFRWPVLTSFNWATDWFDHLAAAQGKVTALWMVEEDGSEEKVSYADLSERSKRVAGWLLDQGVESGDRVLLVLGNCVPLWELMLACIRLGAVMIPATTLLGRADLQDRITRGRVKAVVTETDLHESFAGLADDLVRIGVGDPVDGWAAYADSAGHDPRDEPAETAADDPLLLYFTSGTTAQPKLVEHTHASYPVGHLATMYWLGLRSGDVHLNISSPGWAKHAWSLFFAPFNAGTTVLVLNYVRFDADALLDVMARTGVTTFCAPPTVWRMLIQADLAREDLSLREVVAAGEPLNPEVIERVRAAWDLTIRDGYGQTETCATIANSAGQPVRLGSMGRPMPGYQIALVDPVSGEIGDEGEICLELTPRPAGLMTGYHGDEERTAEVMRDGHFHTGDLATRDADGSITYVGRSDDVFKASDYRISPFELESVLLEHPAVAEAAVVPSPDPVRLAVPKAFVMLAAGHAPDRDTALDIMTYAREHLAPYKRVRRLEFVSADEGLPKTVSGKIRRVELRAAEEAGTEDGYTEDDFPELRS